MMTTETTTAFTVKPVAYQTRYALSPIPFERAWKLAADHGHEGADILARPAMEDDIYPLPVPVPLRAAARVDG